MTFATMNTKLFLLTFVTAGLLHAADDPLAAARAALDHHQVAAAEAALAPLVAEPNPDPQAWFLLSRVRMQQHRAKEAVALAEQAAKARPNVAAYQSNLGVALSHRIGEVNFMQQAMLAGQMVAAFKKSIALDPNHVSGYIGLARYYTNAPTIAGGGRGPAERYAREVEKRSPTLGTMELAAIAEHFGDLPQALALYTKAAAAEPRNGWIAECLGRVSEKLKQADRARAYYEQALALDPSLKGAKSALERLAAAKT